MATISLTGAEEIEQNKNAGHVSTFMRLLTSEDGSLLSGSDKVDESQNGNKGSSRSKIFTENHEEVAKRGKEKRYLPLIHTFGFCKTFKKITKRLGFHLKLKTAY